MHGVLSEAVPVREGGSVKIEIGKIPVEISALDEVAVGNVYRAKGGRGTQFFIIIAITEQTAHAIGIDQEGAVVSTTSYGLHTFKRRDVVAKVPALADMRLDLEWLPI